MRALIAAFLLLAATPALADQTSGTVASFDPAKNWLKFTDHTVWMLPASVVMPEDVQPGDRLQIIYLTNSDNGWQSIQSITRMGSGG